MNVLLVSAGRRVELLELLRAACGGGSVVAVDTDPLAPALYRADAGEAVPRVEEAGFVERLLELCERYEIALVAPTTDRELAILAEGVRTISSRSQWTDPPADDVWLVQPLIAAPEITLDVLAAEGGRIVSLGARRRLKVRGGEVERAVTVNGEPFVELAGAISTALDLSGPFNFQIFIQEDGPPLVGELNPRLGGGLPLSQHAGAMLLEALCEWAATGAWPDGPPRLARAGAHMTRHDSSIFLEGGDLLW